MPPRPLRTWLQRTVIAALDALTCPPGPKPPEAPADDSPVVPPDSPALLMVVRQAELEARHSGKDLAHALATGDALYALYALGGAERVRRQALAAKVRRGAPVTQRELVAATTGYTNAMGAAGDATRVALAVGMAGAPSPAPRAAANTTASGSSNAPPNASANAAAAATDPAALTRDLARWLGERPASLLQNLRAQPRLADRFARLEPAYEVVAICWARTALGEGHLRREDLPPALDQWLATDRLVRQPGSPAPDELKARAWQVDLVTAAVPRAAPHGHVA